MYRNVVKKKKTPIKKPINKKEQPKEEEVSSDDDDNEQTGPNSDDDLDNFEEPDSDEELVNNFEEESEDNFDEGDLNDEDMDQLLAQSEESKPAANKKTKEANDSDEEMDYETKPRKIASEWTRKDYHTKLPIKLPGGKLKQLDETQDTSDEEEETVEEEPVKKGAAAAVVEEEKEEEQEPEIRLSKKEYLLKKKEELATIAGNLQGDPEEYVGQLRTLRSIYRERNVTVKKLALLTQLAVYKDIIPGYRIRPLTALEEETQVSREVKKMREFEKSLLANYELYLKDLNVLLTRKSLL